MVPVDFTAVSIPPALMSTQSDGATDEAGEAGNTSAAPEAQPRRRNPPRRLQAGAGGGGGCGR